MPICWQQVAATKLEESHLRGAIWPHLTETEKALTRSQSGPMAAVTSICRPTSPLSRLDAQEFRVLLCRRLWLPLTLTLRYCRCGRPLDSRGHHRAACATVGVLGARGFPLESAAARVFREAGGRVSMHVREADLDIPQRGDADNRRLEVVCDGLPLFQGAQLCVDTSMVSAVKRDSTARRQCAKQRSGPCANQERQGVNLP